MKKIGSLLLALVLAAGLAVPALAAEDVDIMPISAAVDETLLIAPNPNAGPIQPEYRPGGSYSAVLVLNGEVLDTSALPDVDGIPLRLLAESDHGSASWDEESGEGTGYFDGGRISVNVRTMALSVDSEVQENVLGNVKKGFSFVPAQVIDSLEGYSVTVTEENGVKRYEVATPNGTPMAKMAYEALEVSGCLANGKTDVATFAENLGFAEGTIEDGLWFIGISWYPDCMVIAKLGEKADEEAIRSALQEYCKNQAEGTFSWYGNPEANLPKLENPCIEMKNGYLFFLVAEDSAAGGEVFNAFVAEQG